MTHKRCSKCRRTLPVKRFNRDPNNSSGLRSECYDCRNAVRNARNARDRADLAIFRSLKASGKLRGLIGGECAEKARAEKH